MKLKEIMTVLDFQKQIVSLAKSTNTKYCLGYHNHNHKNFSTLYENVYTKPFNEKKLELALTDTDGGLVFDSSGNYKFNKENYKKLTEFSESLFEKEVEFEFYSTKFSSLSEKERSFYIKTEDGREFFSGIITEETYKLLSCTITELPELVYDETTV